MTLTREWVELALKQAEANDASFVSPEFRESQRNYAELCHHWLATQSQVPVAWAQRGCDVACSKELEDMLNALPTTDPLPCIPLYLAPATNPEESQT